MPEELPNWKPIFIVPCEYNEFRRLCRVEKKRASCIVRKLCHLDAIGLRHDHMKKLLSWWKCSLFAGPLQSLPPQLSNLHMQKTAY
jgi:hypothetical protein